jgi:cellulose biosynthesis protein BcsQ
MILRNTYAYTDKLQYRLRAACALLGVTDNTLRGYADNAGITIKRASDIIPGSPAVRVFEPDSLFRIAQWRRSQGYTKSPASNGNPVVIAVDIIKGGTGKTTTAVELALYLQLLGLKTLLIDVDVQANSTHLMGYEADLEADEAAAYGLSEEAIISQTFAQVLIPFIEKNRGMDTRQSDAVNVIKKPFGEYGPHLVPADAFLADIEFSLANAKGQREMYFRKVLGASCKGAIPGFAVGDYDVVIFDCPTNVSFTSTAALAAADIVIAPIKLDVFAFKGLTKLMGELNVLEKEYTVRPELVILPTHYAPQLSRIGRMQSKLDTYRDMIAPCVISASEEFPKSQDEYLPLSLQKPTCVAAKEYRMFAEHMFNRILAKSAEKARAAA